MARSDTVTLLPLDRWALLMQLNLPHFNQMNGPKAPFKGGCDDLWDQDARDNLAWAIQQAEELIANELGYFPIPAFTTDELHLEDLTGVRADWLNAELQTEHGLVTAYGMEQLTLLMADATVEYLDLDHDPAGREETAEIGGAIYEDLPACANPCDVAVFFRVADGAEDPGDPRWEIKPLKVDIDGPTMRIRAESSMFIRPDLTLLTQINSAGTDDPNAWKQQWQVTNLVNKVDVYCRSVNTALPLTLQWDGVCSCTSPCSHKTQTACAYPTDPRHGAFIARPATGANIFTPPTYWKPPESVIVNYRSGLALDRNCRMNSNLERAIVKLTNVLLPEPPCGFCDMAASIWKMDRSPIDPLTPEAASMPWDLYARGVLEAWRIVKKLAMGRGGKMGRQ